MSDKAGRGNATVCLPELKRGNIGLVLATQIARYVAPGNPLPGWNSPEQAWAATQAQLAWYRAMEEHQLLTSFLFEVRGLKFEVSDGYFSIS